MTEKQISLYRFIRDYWRENGMSPNYREMSRHLGLKSHTAMAGYLNSLERNGLITRAPYGQWRNIKPIVRQCPHCNGDIEP